MPDTTFSVQCATQGVHTHAGSALLHARSLIRRECSAEAAEVLEAALTDDMLVTARDRTAALLALALLCHIDGDYAAAPLLPRDQVINR